MKRRWIRAAAAILVTLTMIVPSYGATVTANGTQLSSQQAWVEKGTSFITLRTFAALTPYALSWDGTTAHLTGAGLNLQARPGDPYITVNGRALYVPEQVRVVDGKSYLPLRVLANATGAGLTWDSAAATARLDTTRLNPPSASYNADDLYWLSRVISAESLGEPLRGQIAVGNVVLNRVKSPQFPNTIQGVVFDQKYGVQFEPVSNRTIYSDPAPMSILAAKLCLEGASVVGGSLYFFAPALSPGTWIRSSRTYHTTIGCHRFYL